MKQSTPYFIAFTWFCCALLSCSGKKKADLLVYNATVYTVDGQFSNTTSLVVNKGKIEATGDTKTLQATYSATTEVDANGKFIYPGFIDAHTHFYRYGLGLQTADLVGTTGWEDILVRLQTFAEKNKEGWLIGRGWDQNDWAVKEFPSREKLDSLFPDRPVFLTRIDGHAAIVNNKALEIAGLTTGITISGGQLEKKNGKLTGKGYW
jgi:predicted amidohydrolase YtcJ